MIIAANIGVCDEIELIERHLRHLQAIGVDHIVVTDTGSTDGTAELLQAWADRGAIRLLRTGRDDPEAFSYANRMLQTTLDTLRPDWVLFGDADEFHIPRSGSLRDVLAQADSDVLRVRRFNVPVSDTGPLWPDDLGPAGHASLLLITRPVTDFHQHLQTHPDTPWILGWAAPKVIARGAAVAAGIQMGAHAALPQGRTAPLTSGSGDVLIAHVPISSAERFERKLDNIRKVFASHGDRYIGTEAWHWRRWLQLADADRSDEEYRRLVFDAGQLRQMQASGQVKSAAAWFGAAARQR